MSKAKGSHGVGIGIKENSTRGWTVIPRLNTVSKDHRLVMRSSYWVYSSARNQKKIIIILPSYGLHSDLRTWVQQERQLRRSKK